MGAGSARVVQGDHRVVEGHHPSGTDRQARRVAAVPRPLLRVGPRRLQHARAARTRARRHRDSWARRGPVRMLPVSCGLRGRRLRCPPTTRTSSEIPRTPRSPSAFFASSTPSAIARSPSTAWAPATSANSNTSMRRVLLITTAVAALVVVGFIGRMFLDYRHREAVQSIRRTLVQARLTGASPAEIEPNWGSLSSKLRSRGRSRPRWGPRAAGLQRPGPGAARAAPFGLACRSAGDQGDLRDPSLRRDPPSRSTVPVDRRGRGFVERRSLERLGSRLLDAGRTDRARDPARADPARRPLRKTLAKTRNTRDVHALRGRPGRSSGRCGAGRQAHGGAPVVREQRKLDRLLVEVKMDGG